MSLQDPTTTYPTPEQPEQDQQHPGTFRVMDPAPDHGETSYTGTGKLEGRRALVTGGLGFIGSNLVVRLVELGAEVTVVDSLVVALGANPFNLSPVEGHVRVERADIRDPGPLAPLVRGQDLIFSLAGQVSHVDSMIDPIGDLELNCRTQLAVLEAWRAESPGATLVFTASRQQYGRAAYLPLDEQHPLRPVDVNGIHKTAAEAAVMLYHEVYGLRACSLRLTNTYGPRMQMRHPRQGFVPWFVRLALEGREIELFGGGTALRDFNYVDDVVEALLLCGVRDEAVGEIFNLGHPEPVSLREFVEVLLEVTGRGSHRVVELPPERARIDIGSVYASHGKIRLTLGWEPRTWLREGLARMIDHFRTHEAL